MGTECDIEYSDYKYYILAFCSFTSILGSLFIIILYIIAPSLRSYSYTLVCNIAVSDLIGSTCYILSSFWASDQIPCEILSIIFDSSQVITIVWSASIALNIYLAVVRCIENVEIYYKYWVVFCYFVIPAINVIPLLASDLGNNDGICSFQENSGGNLWRMCLMYAPAWTLTLIVGFSYWTVYFKLKYLDLNSSNRKMITRFIYYPIVLIIVLTPATALRIAEFSTESCDLIYFYWIASCINSLHGLFDAFIYGFSLEVKNFIRGLLNQKKQLLSSNQIYVNDSLISGRNLLVESFRSSKTSI
jgi:cAMP receptor-like G-protein coupled receptor